VVKAIVGTGVYPESTSHDCEVRVSTQKSIIDELFRYVSM